MNRIGVVIALNLLSLVVLGQTLSYQEVEGLEKIVEGRVNSEWAMSQPYVIMISIDGFRYDYVEKYGASNIQSIIDNGVSAERMIPSFPSKTFPNHYTIVTGMYPSNHGLVSNEFYSRSKDYWYKIRDKKAVTDSSWYDGVPIWVLAERQQMLAANFFWVGSEAPIGGVISTYSYAYTSRIANEHRVDKMIDWLDLPEIQRPHLILGYFSLVDDAGHRYGPDHEKTKEAVLEIDRIIGKLLIGVEQTNLPVNIVLVSDHGMTNINRGIVLPEVVDLDDAQVAYSFPPMIYQPDSTKLEKLYQDLLTVENIDVYKQDAVPDYLSFNNNEDCIGDLILISQAPTVILERPQVVTGGTHGFNPFDHEEMGAIFYGTGPDFKVGLEISPFQNIHVYPLIAQILGLNYTHQIDGKPAVLSYTIRK
ncbi:MAG: alkaline phosphatase family protein [Rickettsiales bacterium]|nr:alkaline phosphatase family protein [Rickettsiales bacterium]